MSTSSQRITAAIDLLSERMAILRPRVAACVTDADIAGLLADLWRGLDAAGVSLGLERRTLSTAFKELT